MNKIDKFLVNLQKVPATAKIFLLQNLTIIVKAGIPLADGLKTIGKETKHKKLKLILKEIAINIRQGKSFGDCLEPYQNDFGEMFVNMVKAGESSGRLEDVLKELYSQTKKDHELKSKVTSALIYPAVILCAMVGIGIFVILFVLPNITSMFSQLDIKLPIATRILIKISDIE